MLILWLSSSIIVCVIFFLLHPIQETKSLEWSRGNFEAFMSIVGYAYRDFDLTISLHPQYISFNLSLWFFAIGIFWSMFESHLDCEQDQGHTAANKLLRRVMHDMDFSTHKRLQKDIKKYLENHQL